VVTRGREMTDGSRGLGPAASVRNAGVRLDGLLERRPLAGDPLFLDLLELVLGDLEPLADLLDRFADRDRPAVLEIYELLEDLLLLLHCESLAGHGDVNLRARPSRDGLKWIEREM